LIAAIRGVNPVGGAATGRGAASEPFLDELEAGDDTGAMKNLSA
jgi:hypothetical protein